MPDRRLVCRQCGRDFVFTEGEQRFFAERGYRPPTRCPQCRQRNRSSQPSQAHSGSAHDHPAVVDRPPGLPADYLREGYHDTYGLLRREIFAQEAREVALALTSPQLGSSSMKNSSLRRFFNQLKALQYEYNLQHDFGAIVSKLYAFLNAAEYAVARNVVPQLFKDFVAANVQLASQGPEEFKGFLEHYESVVAYARNDQGQSPVQWLNAPGLPDGYLAQGYFDTDGHLLRQVLVEWPQHLVQTFAHGRPPLTSSALRNFFTKLKGLENRLRASHDMARVLPDLYAFERDAAYAANRQVVPPVFFTFIVKNVDLATANPHSFTGFKDHFQAVVAYGKGALREGGSRR
ncbi:MAG: CRISPR-associated protein Csm2 [Bacillota bacterium]|nr:CRISPR-associated protein Csm2 [Bacillota bacterium]